MQPQLTRRSSGRDPRGLVLMMHGGAEHDLDPVTGLSRPWLRSRVMMAQLGGAFRRAGLDLWLLRFGVVGWNHGHAEHPSPVPDARWALDRARERYGGLPVVLLGHSMGARTAVAVADDPQVAGVVGLAPWLPPGEPVEPLAGKHLVAAHGRADRITSYAATEAFVRRAQRVAASAALIDMGDLDHYLVRGLRRWNAVARTQTLTLLAGDRTAR
jgi:predicted esterase